jgi:hypothetical protein
VGEEFGRVAAPDAPGDLALVAVLDLAGHPDPVVPGVLPELIDPPGLRRGLVGVGGVAGQFGLRQPAPDDDLVAVDHDLRRFGEPAVRRRTGDPGGGVIGGRRFGAGPGRGRTKAHGDLQRCG